MEELAELVCGGQRDLLVQPDNHLLDLGGFEGVPKKEKPDVVPRENSLELHKIQSCVYFELPQESCIRIVIILICLDVFEAQLFQFDERVEANFIYAAHDFIVIDAHSI